MARRETMNIRQWWHALLERLHLLHTVLDIGEELRLIEVLVIGPWKKCIYAHTESFYDDTRLAFSVERFLQKYATYPVKRLHLTISRISVISYFLPLPDIPREKLEQVIEWQLSKLLHLSPQDMAVGFQVLSRTHISGSPGWNVLSSVMRKNELLQYHELLEEIHLFPYEMTYIAHLALFPYLPRRSDQVEGVVVWHAHRILMAIVEKGDIVQYQHHLLPENRHLPSELKAVTQFFTEYIKLGGGYLVKIHLKALSEEEEQYFIEGILESINILAEGIREGDSFFVRSGVPSSYWDMYSIFSPDAKRYRVAFPLPQGLHRMGLDALVQWGLALCAGVILVGLLLAPWMAYTHYQYRQYQEAEKRLASGEAVKDPRLEERIEEVRQLQLLRQYQKEKLRYEQLITDVQSVGIESSNLKMVIVALSQALPSDVRVQKLSVQKGKGEIVGEARSSKGVQDFVKGLLQSPYFKQIAVGEVKRAEGGALLSFRILFEVSL